MAQNNLKTLGQQLKAERIAKGLRQSDVGAKAVLSAHTVGNVENHGWGSTYTIIRVINALGKTLTIN